MKHWININYKSLIIAAFLIPIITVAIVSISHVTKWYGISNPVSWAIYLSIGIEIAALSALAAISADMGKKVYFPFAIVTLVQFIGNIFFAYSYIDINTKLFKDWVDLVSPLVSFMGVEQGDLVGHKRFLALFAGGMLPIISLSFLHMLVKFTEEDRKKEVEEDKKEIEPIPANHLMSEVSKVRLSEEDLKKLEEVLLNPPPPNENLKNAAEEYKKKLELTDEEILERAKEIQIKKVFEEAEIIKQEREEEFGPDNLEEEPFEEKKSIFPEEVEYPEEYNRPVYPSKEEIKEILSEMMRLDQELGLYDPPHDTPQVKEEITPALSDEEVKEMFMDEWEKTYDLVEEDEISDWDVTLMDGLENEEISTIEPSEEEELQNFSTIQPNSENIFQEEDYQGQFEEWKNETVSEPLATEEEIIEDQNISVEEVVNKEPEINLEVKETSSQNEEDEKKN
jgi:hypothetical protein